MDKLVQTLGGTGRRDGRRDDERDYTVRETTVRLLFVVRIDVAVLPNTSVGATGGFLRVEHIVEERFGESARRRADVDTSKTGFENVDGDGFGGVFVAEEGHVEGW